MITDGIYDEQIKRLEDGFMYSINEAALNTWLKELEKEGIENQDLAKGVDYILNNPSKFTIRPHLGTLLEWCGKAKAERWEKEESKKKADLATELTNVHPKTDHGLKALSLIKLILQGSYVKDGKSHELTKNDKVDYMLKMEEYFPGYGWEREAMKLAKHYGIN